jgi:hypothetical protein
LEGRQKEAKKQAEEAKARRKEAERDIERRRRKVHRETGEYEESKSCSL